VTPKKKEKGNNHPGEKKGEKGKDPSCEAIRTRKKGKTGVFFFRIIFLKFYWGGEKGVFRGRKSRDCGNPVIH